MCKVLHTMETKRKAREAERKKEQGKNRHTSNKQINLYYILTSVLLCIICYLCFIRSFMNAFLLQAFVFIGPSVLRAPAEQLRWPQFFGN